MRWLTSAAVPNSATIEFLASLPMEVEKLRNHHPIIFRYDVSRLRAVIDFLIANEIDHMKVLKQHPRVFQSKPEVMASNLSFLQTLPINVAKAVEACPRLLYLPIPTIQSRIGTLTFLGVRLEAIMKFPRLLGFSNQAIRQRLAFLNHLGLDATRIAERCPSVFGRTERNILEHIDFFENFGLDAKRIINSQPSVLNRDIHRGLGTVFKFIKQEMGRSLEEINRTPNCFLYSLEKRMKPRYEYMKRHGVRKDYALGTLFAPTDQCFAWSVARRPLVHYHDWLKLGL